MPGKTQVKPSTAAAATASASASGTGLAASSSNSSGIRDSNAYSPRDTQTAHTDVKHRVSPTNASAAGICTAMVKVDTLCAHEDDGDMEYMDPVDPTKIYDLQQHCQKRARGAKFGSPRLTDPDHYYVKDDIVALIYETENDAERKRGYARVIRTTKPPGKVDGDTKVVVQWFYRIGDVEEAMLQAGRHDDLEALGVDAGALIESNHCAWVGYDNILCLKQSPFDIRYRVTLPEKEGGELKLEALSKPLPALVVKPSGVPRAVGHSRFTPAQSAYNDFLCAHHRTAHQTTFCDIALRTAIRRQLMKATHPDRLEPVVFTFLELLTAQIGVDDVEFELNDMTPKLKVAQACYICDTRRTGHVFEVWGNHVVVGQCCERPVRHILESVFRRIYREYRDVQSARATAAELADHYSILDNMLHLGSGATRRVYGTQRVGGKRKSATVEYSSSPEDESASRTTATAPAEPDGDGSTPPPAAKRVHLYPPSERL